MQFLKKNWNWLLSLLVAALLVAETLLRTQDGVNLAIIVVITFFAVGCMLQGAGNGGPSSTLASGIILGIALIYSVLGPSAFYDGCRITETGALCDERRHLEASDREVQTRGTIFLEHRDTEFLVRPDGAYGVSDGIRMARGTRTDTGNPVEFLVPYACDPVLLLGEVRVRSKTTTGTKAGIHVLLCPETAR